MTKKQILKDETRYYDNGEIQFQRKVLRDGQWEETHFDCQGNILSFTDSHGYWEKRTYDEWGFILSYEDSKSENQKFFSPFTPGPVSYS